MELALKCRGAGCAESIDVVIDDYENGEVLGKIDIGLGDGIYRGRIKNITGRHAVFFKARINTEKGNWMRQFFENRNICEIEEFVFLK